MKRINTEENYLSSIASYVMRWYVPSPTTKCSFIELKRRMCTYAALKATNLLDQLYASILFARLNNNDFIYRPNTIEVKAGDKSRDVLRMLYSGGVDIESFMPYRIAYVGDHSKPTAELLAKQLHATHICDIADAPDNGVELAVAISTMHQRRDRNISVMAPKLVTGGLFVIRENDLHTNRKNKKNRDYAATEFLDVMGVAMEIIESVDSIEVPAHLCEIVGDNAVLKNSGTGSVENNITIPSKFVHKYGDKIRIQHDCPAANNIITQIDGATVVSWEDYKKYLIDSGLLRINTYKNMKSWDSAFAKNGFETFEPITYEKSNPHRVYYKLYRKL